MSRIGKQPIELPEGVKAEIDGNEVKITGPKGENIVKLPPKVLIEQKENSLVFSIPNENDKKQGAFWGLARSLVNGAVKGVTEEFSKKLEITGVGYRVELKGDALVFNLGFSHPVEFKLPKGISAKTEGNSITVWGVNKQLVGEIASQIRALKKPEPYKGKGIRYSGEVLRRKVGKMVKGSE